MKELVGQVEKLVAEEGTRSMIEHPLFNSTHEGYAVIKEEVEEVSDEKEILDMELGNMWCFVKNDNNNRTLGEAVKMKVRATNLAAEAIQVAAMAQKFIDSFKVENE